MKYYLGADGGGTKLNLILFDENYHLVSKSTSGSVNHFYFDISIVRQHIEEAIAELLKPFNGEHIKVEEALGVFMGPVKLFNECLAAAMDVPTFRNGDEGYMYLLAGGLTDKGGCALLGTGDGAIYINGKDDIHHCGGYGSYMGEDGSGWWIGNRGMFAAVQQIDNWGPKTLLTPYLFEYLKVDDKRKLIPAVYSNPDGTHVYTMIANFARWVGRAAHEGDTVALSILHEAGELMAKKMIGCYTINHADPKTHPIYACGGAWKAHPIMLEACNQYMAEYMPDAVVQYALFDPVVAAIVQKMLDDGRNPREYESLLRDQYKDHLIQVI